MNCNTINNDVTMAGGGGTLLANRYRVVRQLGQGGMGSVWLAEDTQLDGKLFAIKMLPSILVANKRAYRQLKDEALVAMRLVHPNIVQIRAFEENNGNPFLVMDYIEGQTLDDYLAEHWDVSRRDAEAQRGRAGAPRPPQGGLPESEVIRILKPIAGALDYAHGEGVVHRDVKPANVMIRKDGHPFILDFGIAREIHETMTRVTGKLSSGTLLYMSPEQLDGDPPKKEQDIYSFAAMAYECLKGEPPFVRGAIEDQIRNKRPTSLTGGPRSVAAAIMAGLAKKPEDRPPTCTAVLEGDGFCCVERAEGNASRRGAETQRGGGAGKVIAALALVAAIGVGGWIYHQKQGKRRAEQMGQETESALAFTNVVGDCKTLIEQSKARDKAKPAAEILAEVIKVAQSVGSKEYASVMFSSATDLAKHGPSEFDAKETDGNKANASNKVRIRGGMSKDSVTIKIHDNCQMEFIRNAKGGWIAKSPVSWREYVAVVGKAPVDVLSFDAPATNVSAEDCELFLQKLSRCARLPKSSELGNLKKMQAVSREWCSDIDLARDVVLATAYDFHRSRTFKFLKISRNDELGFRVVLDE